MARRSARHAERVFVLEGAKLLSEAIAAGAAVESVFLAAGAPDDAVALAHAAAPRVHVLAPGVMERVAGTVTPQPLLAVAEYVDVGLDALAPARLVVVMVDVRDPGNAGTTIRCAEAAGADGVVCGGSTVDVYNPKTVRASAGALFHVPVAVVPDAAAALGALGRFGLRRLAAVSRGGADYAAVDLTDRVAFVVGNEAGGLPDAVVSTLDAAVSIPMAGRSESLNVGTAAAVLCFEAARQRRMSASRPEAVRRPPVVARP